MLVGFKISNPSQTDLNHRELTRPLCHLNLVLQPSMIGLDGYFKIAFAFGPEYPAAPPNCELDLASLLLKSLPSS